MTVKPRIAVFGSVHMDLIAHAERLPEKAASGLAHGFSMGLGGKGGNQAGECATAGAEVFMVTQLGDDEFGRTMLAQLKSRGVDCTRVVLAEGMQTGASTVLTAPEGYSSLIYPGAAAAMKVEDVAARVESLRPLDMVLLQLELPTALSLAAATAAKNVGAHVVLNASPVLSLNNDLRRLLELTSLLVVNEAEAAALGGIAGIEKMTDAQVVVTLGARGSLASDGRQTWTQAALPVTVKSTVGAGDAFLAGLCASLCREYNLGLGLVAAAQSARLKLESL